MKRLITAGAAALTALLVAASAAACGSSDDDQGGGGTQKLTVFAAASLTESFTALGKRFEKDHPGTKVVFSFGPSSGLADQIKSGAPAGVFASAAPKNMDDVVSAGDAKKSTNFAKNSMEIATPPSNPKKITGVDQLAGQGVKVAVCAAEVPCGATALQVFKNAGITVKPATEEVDVKSVLTKVTLGEVDAGVVYVTDVRAAGSKVKGVEIASDANASTEYPIATLTHAKHPKLAQQFVDLVLSSEGSQTLQKAGFQAP